MIVKGNILRDINTANEEYLIDLEYQVKVTLHRINGITLFVPDELTENDLKRSKGIITFIKDKNPESEKIKNSLRKLAEFEKNYSNTKVRYFFEYKEIIV